MTPLLLLALTAHATEPHRSFTNLPSSNGWGAVVVDFEQRRAHHWRDHLFATEEPLVDGAGNEVWLYDQPQSVYSRDLLYDAYFGIRAGGSQQWLTDLPVDLDASGYLGVTDPAPAGGTPILSMVQERGDLRLTTHTFAPWGLSRSAMVMILEVQNAGASPVADLAAFSVHNLHLGEGRPGPTAEIGAENETVVITDGRIEERGFAGVTSLAPLRPATAASAYYPGAAWSNGWEVVNGGAVQDLAAKTGDLGYHTDTVSYLQWDHGALGPGQTAWFGLVIAHHGDPFAVDALSAEVDAWVAGRDAAAILADERATWGDFGATVDVPGGLSAEEDALYRHSAVVLRMAQVREDRTYVREWLSRDGEPRYSAFGATPGELTHLARGGVLASLPPGQWTYAWPRDGAYAVLGMSLAGMHDEAREALRYMLDAESNRFVDYGELSGVPVVDYQISLCRHHGFGIEESDTLGGGDFNFEFDGAGLFLWAARAHAEQSGDWSLIEERWPTIRDRVAGFLVPLIDADGLIAADSSIWEHHWFGAERQWSFTSLTAARGLCDAAAMADHMGDASLAATYRDAAEQLRGGILDHLRDADGAVASTREELDVGHGYADVSAIEAASMGLFSPTGVTSPATLQLLVDELQTPDGPGFSRNDDAWDEHDLSWWGSSYDSDEWVWADLRAEVAARHTGDVALADEILEWITGQSTANFLAIGETYDPFSGDYTNNAPMVGYGAGAYIVALNHRQGLYTIDAACGAYPDDGPPDTEEPGDTSDTADTGEPVDTDDTGTPDTDPDPNPDDTDPIDTSGPHDTGFTAPTNVGCGCAAPPAAPAGLALLLLPALAALRRRRA